MKKSLIKDFEKIISRKGGGYCFSKPEDLGVYSYDAYPEEPKIPSVVVIPKNYDQVKDIILLCKRSNTPLTVRGAGTNLSGGTIPLKKGCVLVTTLLKNIIHINTEDLYVTTQIGITTQKLADAVMEKGLLYPPDPASMKVSTIGGNIAENSGGLRALKYGVTDRYVMEVKFFDSDGNLVKGGGKPIKLVTGFNLPGLLIGSEGSFGVMVEATLKLIPPPLSKKAMLVYYYDLIKASQTVSKIISEKILPATLEIMDNFTIKAIEKVHKLGLPISAAALLLIELDGHPAAIEDEYEKVKKICSSLGGEIYIAKDDSERDKLWEARRNALSSLALLKPTLILEDATVPRSKVPEMMKAIQKIAKKHDLLIGTFGHAGDGNLHPTILTDRRDKKEMERVYKAIDEIFEEALKLDGTLTGEHGVGIAKSKYLENELGRETIEFMKKIKKGIDPYNILNPGKIIGY